MHRGQQLNVTCTSFAGGHHPISVQKRNSVSVSVPRDRASVRRLVLATAQKSHRESTQVTTSS
jgi:hypothetical protein